LGEGDSFMVAEARVGAPIALRAASGHLLSLGLLGRPAIRYAT